MLISDWIIDMRDKVSLSELEYKIIIISREESMIPTKQRSYRDACRSARWYGKGALKKSEKQTKDSEKIPGR